MNNNKKIVTATTFFFSFSTWICCVLPMLITLIAGTQSVSALVTSAPLLVEFSYYKDWTFLFVGLLLVFNGVFLFHPVFQKECPKEFNELCLPLKKSTRWIYYSSIVVYLIGFSVSYIFGYIYLMYFIY